MSKLFAKIKSYLWKDNNLHLLEEIRQLRSRLEHLEPRVANLEPRVANLEHRLLDYYTNRWDIIFCIADYLVNAELPGDYAEFGVYKGTTFGYTANLFHTLFPQMRFLAFDSFEGLPEPMGLDKWHEGFASGFFKGQFAASEDEFRRNVFTSAPKLSEEKLITTKGWFDQTLTHKCAQKIGLQKLAFVWIDCDFYESTIPILQFITPYLSIGTVIFFDDWRCYRNLSEFGQQRACREWLEENPKITLNEFIFGLHGMSFTVGSLPDAKE